MEAPLPSNAPTTLIQALWAAVGILVAAVAALWRGERKAVKECDARMKEMEERLTKNAKDQEERFTRRISELEAKYDATNEKRIADFKEGAETMQEIVERNTKVLERVLDRISRPG